MKKILVLSVAVCGVFLSVVMSVYAEEKLNLAVAEFEARNARREGF